MREVSEGSVHTDSFVFSLPQDHPEGGMVLI